METELSLAEFFAQVFAPRRLAGKSPLTIRKYLIALRHFDLFLGRCAKLADLTEENGAAFLTWYAAGSSPNSRPRGKPIAAATVNSVREKIGCLWTYAAKKGRLSSFPELPSWRELRRRPVAWTPEQVGKILATSAGMRGTIDGIPERLWWQAVLSVIYWTGARIGALMQLRWPDVDLSCGRILLRAEHQKDREDQFFELPADVVLILERLKKTGFDDVFVFPWPYCLQTLYRRLSGILKRANLPHGPRDKFHKLRRTNYTLVYKHVGPTAAQENAGHSSPLLAKNYLDVSQLQLPRPADLIPAPIFQR